MYFKAEDEKCSQKVKIKQKTVFVVQDIWTVIRECVYCVLFPVVQ